MLLTITASFAPASDLGFLLHKHPERVQEFGQAYGTAYVFYPEAGEERCTAALLLDVDPVRLARGRRDAPAEFSLGQYVNDRPYAASSLLASAMAGVFRTAMRGRCDARPELAAMRLPLEITLPALPCRGGPEVAHALFEPLGWRVGATPVPLDENFPEWGDSRYVRLVLSGEMRLADALNQLYVLLPVLDEAKHYWISPDEVDKLIRSGEGWLATHPARARIVRRYLANRHTLVRTARHRLAEVDDVPEEALDRDPIDEEPTPADPTTADPETVEPAAEPTAEPEAPRLPLNERRIQAVLEQLRAVRARSVIDLGCGSGKLLARLTADRTFERVAGSDVSPRALAFARRKRAADGAEVFQGALTYADERFRGYDAAVLMEVIEHIDPDRLPAVGRVVFGDARPGTVIVTTPNVEYNVRYPDMTGMRHPDHRFEWTRAQFCTWAEETARTHGYQVRYVPVGDDDPEVGPPTQMGVFMR